MRLYYHWSTGLLFTVPRTALETAPESEGRVTNFVDYSPVEPTWATVRLRRVGCPAVSTQKPGV